MFFSFEQRICPEEPRAALIKAVGYKLQQGPAKKENYNQDLHFYNKNPEKKSKNTIESFEFFSTTTRCNPHRGRRRRGRNHLTLG